MHESNPLAAAPLAAIRESHASPAAVIPLAQLRWDIANAIQNLEYPALLTLIRIAHALQIGIEINWTAVPRYEAMDQ
jgi:hypothetical protein